MSANALKPDAIKANALKERLSHLLELAARGGEARKALLDELTDLLLDWPGDYTPAMRAPFEALLERAARDTDRATRTALAQRFAGHDELPIELLNDFFPVAPLALKSSILARNERANPSDRTPHGTAANGTALIAAARAKDGLAHALGECLAISPKVTDELLADETALSLAAACKGAHLNRAAFSALAVLSATDKASIQDRLVAYERVPQGAAEGLLRFWRARHGAPAQVQAAE